MDDFKGIVKVDFKEARENSGMSKEMAGNFFMSYANIDLDAVENNEVRISEEQVNTLMGMYNVPKEQRKGYYEKYANTKF